MSDIPESPTGAPPPPPPPGGAPQAAYAYSSAPAASQAEERNWAMAAHLSAFSGVLIPFGSILAPLVIWLVKKDTMPFVAEHAREALNFNITVALIGLVCALLTFVLIGFLLLPALLIAWVVLTVMAGVAASKGERYRYPFTLRLVN
jgi:uncharacterized Tic20 family protein